MSNQINLISRKREKLFNRDFLLRFTEFLARTLLLLIIVFSIGLFILNKSGRLPVLQQQDHSITTNLSLVQQKIIKFLLIKNRLEEINPLMQNRSKIETLAVTVSQGIPSTIAVDSFSLTKGTLSLAVSSSSLPSIDAFLDFMLDKVKNKELFKKITITRFINDAQNGKYSLALQITLL